MSRIVSIVAIAKSSNTKTGNIPQTYSSANTCAKSCPFNKDENGKYRGCYAAADRTCITWNRANKGGMPLENLKQWVETNTVKDQVLRHNVAGDICKENSDDIDTDLVNTLINAYESVRAYTYTHAAITPENQAIIKKSIKAGFTINQSCETLEQCDKCIDNDIPAVLAVTKFTSGTRTPKGRRLIQCPAQRKPDLMNCKTCGICLTAYRPYVVCFEAHGQSSKKAIAAINKANEK